MTYYFATNVERNDSEISKTQYRSDHASIASVNPAVDIAYIYQTPATAEITAPSPEETDAWWQVKARGNVLTL